MALTEEEAKSLVKEFFLLLDEKEESDAGHEFHPVYISSCRVLKTQRLGEIFKELREWSGGNLR